MVSVRQLQRAIHQRQIQIFDVMQEKKSIFVVKHMQIPSYQVVEVKDLRSLRQVAQSNILKSAALPLFCRFFRQMWQKSTPLYRSDLVAVGDISKGKQSSCWRKKNQFTVYTVLNFCWMYMPCTWYALSEKDEGIEAHNNY